MRMLGAVLGAMVLSITMVGSAVESTSTIKVVPDRHSLTAVPFTDVQIDDKFWKPRQETNRTVSIPHSLEMLRKAGNFKDLELAAAGSREGYQGPVFIDSDLYKAIEAASYSLAARPDTELQSKVDEVISKIAAAQRPDGYLNTWYQVNAPEKRFTNLRDDHELYCAGHLFEAAAAHHAATGKRSLLDVATRYADLMEQTFGEPPKRLGYCGHEEIELALFKLARAANQPRYNSLARYFLEKRGCKFFASEHLVDPAKYNGEYWQDNCPVRDHQRVVGHAVRMMYLLSAATDLALQTHDPGLITMLDRVWQNTTERNMYITGGIGSSAHNEGFTRDYDLPNSTAYQETCASVGMIMWNHRLAMLHGNSKCADVMERALYNGFLSGVSLDGTRYFYVNPLSSDGKHHRQEWFGCACCPPNVTRTLAQLGGYVYATSPGAAWVNLYIAGQAKLRINDVPVSLTVSTKYPWDARVQLECALDQPTTFALHLRVPGWCPLANVLVNGKAAASTSFKDGYMIIVRSWSQGDRVQLDLEMPISQVASNAKVEENLGKLAVQRGPLVYCVEDVDNPTSAGAIGLKPGTVFDTKFNPDIGAGVVMLTAEGQTAVGNGTRQLLYGPAPKERSTKVTMIPYYAWDNRRAGQMRVWLPAAPPPL